ncbi:MAG: hypothetical protein ACYS9X_02275 [Planctomycetota bacterium]|jgi:hypothetical protein
MRYSYAWDVTPRQFDMFVEPKAENWLAELNWYRRAYLHLRGRRDPYVPFYDESVGTTCYMVCDEDGVVRVAGPTNADAYSPVIVKGRLGSRYRFVFLDTTASRVHPASVAGIVVGAMGCFIFGLYLRRWLRARKALASQPGQDMIA